MKEKAKVKNEYVKLIFDKLYCTEYSGAVNSLALAFEGMISAGLNVSEIDKIVKGIKDKIIERRKQK